MLPSPTLIFCTTKGKEHTTIMGRNKDGTPDDGEVLERCCTQIETQEGWNLWGSRLPCNKVKNSCHVYEQFDDSEQACKSDRYCEWNGLNCKPNDLPFARECTPEEYRRFSALPFALRSEPYSEP